MAQIRVFLSGSVQKGANDTRPQCNYWSDDEENRLRDLISNADVELLNPNKLAVDLSQSLDRFRMDIDMLRDSDLMLVDARTKKGIGVGAEMMMASYEKIPVLALCPEGSEYRKNGNTHAFLAGLCEGVFGSLEELAKEIEIMVQCEKVPRARP